jgi:hypothetical protein
MNLKKLIFIFLFAMQVPVWSGNYAQDVFNRLVNSTGNLYATKPTLVIVKSDLLVAETYSTGEIRIGTALIEKCRMFGKDSSNAIAHILSHELAHYYQNHSWISNFTSAYANVEWSRKLNENEQQFLPVYETQADELGFFYAMNAGYQSWKVASLLLDSIYVWYKLPKDLAGYPPLEQRKKISITASEKVGALVPLFKISNYFTLMGKYFPGEAQFAFYDASGSCLDHLLHENIQTPNILNNLGVLYFLKAQPGFYDPMNKIMYPVVMDLDASAMDMTEMVGIKGLNPSSGEMSAETIDLLERSKDAFEQALKSNKQYVPAHLNIAMVHFVLKEEGSMSDKIKFIKSLNIESNGPMASLVDQIEAFDHYLKGDAKKMTDAFKKAINKGDVSAKFNQDLLAKKGERNIENPEIIKWSIDTSEMIFGKKVGDFFSSYRSSQERRLDPYNEKFILWTDKKPEGCIYTFRSQESQTVFRDLVFFEVEDEMFFTSRGIRLTSFIEELEKVYGNPFYINHTYNGYQYLYPSQSMIVTVDVSTNRVVGIMYYGVKK